MDVLNLDLGAHSLTSDITNLPVMRHARFPLGAGFISLAAALYRIFYF